MERLFFLSVVIEKCMYALFMWSLYPQSSMIARVCEMVSAMTVLGGEAPAGEVPFGESWEVRHTASRTSCRRRRSSATLRSNSATDSTPVGN